MAGGLSVVHCGPGPIGSGIARSVAAGEALALDLRMAVGADKPHDPVLIDRDPPVRMRIEGGVFGDSGTAPVVDAIPRLLRHARGLVAMHDLAPVHVWEGRIG